MRDRVIRKTIEIDAPPDVVFDAITNPDDLRNWFPDYAIFETSVGGKVRFTFKKEHSEKLEKDWVMEGKILEIIPNKKVSYVWKYPYSPNFPETIVTWDLEEISKNRTRVKLMHSGFTGAEGEMFKEHDEGWSFFLGRLQTYCRK